MCLKKTKSQDLVYTHKKRGLNKKSYFTTKRQQKRIQIFETPHDPPYEDFRQCEKSNKICDTSFSEPIVFENHYYLQHRRIPSRKLSAVWDEIVST